MNLMEVLLWSLVGSLASPGVFIPALIIGWIARTPFLALLGGAAIAIALFAYGQLVGAIPVEAHIVWVAVPFMLIPPMIWALAAHFVGRWIRRQAGGDRSHPALRAIEAVIGAIIGMVVGGALGIAAGTLYVEAAQVSNFEGGAGYLVVLGFGMPGVFLGFVAGVVLGWRRRRRRVVA